MNINRIKNAWIILKILISLLNNLIVYLEVYGQELLTTFWKQKINLLETKTTFWKQKFKNKHFIKQ